jgi:hypothetical protein
MTDRSPVNIDSDRITPPRPHLQLSGCDGNAFSIMGRAVAALRKAGRHAEVADYQREAMAGDYDNLLRVTMTWFECD